MSFLRGMLILLGLILAIPSARADERILDFHSDIEIAADATMMVTETIRVNAEGDRIRRGIYRDFPTAYRDSNGRRVNVIFEPLDVTRDGEPEDWHAERMANGVRIYFGNADTSLDHGEHAYVFRYRSARQLGFFDEHDELYWNVTGNGWDFVIDHASATLSLPRVVERERIALEAYTGVQGSTARDYTSSVDANGRARIETRAPLAPENGLTVVFSFPKGVVVEPDLAQNLDWFAEDNQREAVLAVGLLVLIAFLYLQWLRVGRDPPTGVIMPQYDPPEGLSPAAARYVRKMAYDDRCFAADLVELGVRGAVRIRESASRYTLERENGTWHSVSQSARHLYAQLLGMRETLKLENAEHAVVGQARSAHQSFLKEALAQANFRRNDGIVWLGFLIAALAIFGAFLADSIAADEAAIFLTIAVSVLSWLTAAFLGQIIDMRRDGLSAWGYVVAALILLLASAIAIGFLTHHTSLIFAVLVVLLTAVQLPFARWMRAPTVAGRKLLDQIEGLRLYLSVAERDDLARAKAPPMSVDEYQRLLPYALALDVEKTWGDRLASAIGPAAVAAAATGMAWYVSSNDKSFDAANFGSSLGSSLSSAISSSSSPPGSSSGSGGGGSSGGGGGGGGGGGW